MHKETYQEKVKTHKAKIVAFEALIADWNKLLSFLENPPAYTKLFK